MSKQCRKKGQKGAYDGTQTSHPPPHNGILPVVKERDEPRSRYHQLWSQLSKDQEHQMFQARD